MPLFHKKSTKANITPPLSYENNNMSAVNNHQHHHQQHQQQQKSVRYQEQHHLPHHPISPPPAYSTCQSAMVEASIPRPQLIFHCQLAQGSPTGLITGFASVKELYQKIAECYDFPVDEVGFTFVMCLIDGFHR